MIAALERAIAAGMRQCAIGGGAVAPVNPSAFGPGFIAGQFRRRLRTRNTETDGAPRAVHFANVTLPRRPSS